MKKILLMSAACLVFYAVSARAQDMTPMPGDPAPPAQPAALHQAPPLTFLSTATPAAEKPAKKHKHKTAVPEDDAHKQFRIMDRNNDGQVTYEEFSAAYERFYPPVEDPADRGDQFAVLDANGDGVITLKEMVANFHKPIDQNYTMKWVPNGARAANDE
jgi:hypothetical protein